MSLRILLGFDRPGTRGQPTLLYAGGSGTELQEIQAKNKACASFLILNNPVGIRKSNPNYAEPAAATPKKASKAAVEKSAAESSLGSGESPLL